jgi:outer membrane lipoprotein carrier protein
MKKQSADRKIRSWEDKKVRIFNFSISQFLNIGLLLFTIHFSLFTVVYAATLDETVERIQKRYDEIQDIQGKFSQTSYIKDLDRVERYEGEFFIRKPSSMRWLYSEPRDEEVIIREGDIWIYKKSEKQVLKSTYSKDAYSQVPIALLSSIGNLKTDFDIKMIKEDNLELKPLHQMGFIKKILLEVNSRVFPIKAFSIFDIYGNKVDVIVKDIEINPGLKDSFFIFTPPPGVEVFDFNQ